MENSPMQCGKRERATCDESANGIFSLRLPAISNFTSQRERHYEVLEVENLAVARLALD